MSHDTCCISDGDSVCGSEPAEGAPLLVCMRHAHQIFTWFGSEVDPDYQRNALRAARIIASEQDPELVAQSRAREERRQQALRAQSLVYYVRLPGDRIKIGTTTNLTARLVGLRVKASEVLATEPGNEVRERLRHKQFRHLRIGGPRTEDFRPAPELLSHIDAVRATWGEPTITGYIPTEY